MSKSKLKRNTCPYIIHASEEINGFPTHTHGITEMGKGMPEFLIDPLAFGPSGNGNLINAVFNYLSKRDNKKVIEQLKSGQTIKISSKTLIKSDEEEYTCCIRMVLPTFEAVKQAYLLKTDMDGLYLHCDMWFAQIYVEGDDFALTDEYYKGGVKW